MGSKLLVGKRVADRKSGRVLGFQCIGPGNAGKGVATVATAIRGKLTIEELASLNLPYTLPHSLALEQPRTNLPALTYR
ncbi:hypothetical protein G3480_23910 [Thiorhodococcus mannitoliphagus]|uniref:Pyridine nucleotide-disulphide oxidoreductase dimerisation domain-containing protein n=1 Tax=Thiorhodococcus mannitoliphagus TaxID=329406 RepID=A0A6P1E6Y0_9GAMM|nr:hypothetical protein [Thiorhodococcus mannitoliphagus]